MGNINPNALVKLAQLSTATNAIAAKVKELYVAKADATVYENIIESISVNGTAVNPDINKNVALTVPTAVSDLTNDSNFQTDTEVASAISSAIAGVTQFDYQIVNALPAEGEKGVIYLIANSGTGQNVYDEYLWIVVGGTGRFELFGTKEIEVVEYKGDNTFVAVTDGTGDDAGKKVIVLTASAQASLALADSALQIADITAGDGITLTKDTSNNTIEVSAKLKPDSAEVGAEFTNLLKTDANGQLYIDASTVQGTLAGADNNGVETTVTNGTVEATLHVTDKTDNLLSVVAADAGAGTSKGAYVSADAVKGLFSTSDTNSVDASYSDGVISASVKISDKSDNLITVVAADAVAGTSEGLYLSLAYATDEDIAAIVDAAFADEEESGRDEPSIGD